MITALVSRKGGVGKTTTAVSLAAALALRGRRTLLIDLDSQASSSLSLGVRRDALAPSAADILLRELPALDAVRATSLAGLDLITASADLAMAERELSPFSRPEQRLRQSLEPLRRDYDFIFIDCPPSLSLLPTSALLAADTFIVPAVPHFLALEGLDNLLPSIERLRERCGACPRLLGVVLTMVDYRARATRQNVEKIRRRFGEAVFAVEIRTNIRLAEAPECGQPVFQYSPAATGALAYDLLAEELLMRWDTRQPALAVGSG